MVDRHGVLAVEVGIGPVAAGRRREKLFGQAATQMRAAQDLDRRDRNVLVVEEAPVQSKPGGAEDGIRGEPSRIVALIREILGQSGMSPIQRPVEPGRQLVRPSSRKHASVRWKCPGGSRSCVIEAGATFGQFSQVWRGRALVAIDAQAAGSDGIEHDQEDIWRARRCLRQPKFVEFFAAVVEAKQEGDQPKQSRKTMPHDSPLPLGHRDDSGCHPPSDAGGERGVGDGCQSSVDEKKSGRRKKAEPEQAHRDDDPPAYQPGQRREDRPAGREDQPVGNRHHPECMLIELKGPRRRRTDEMPASELQTKLQQTGRQA